MLTVSALRCAIATLSLSVVFSPTFLFADSFTGFTPGNLVVSRSVYAGDASTVIVGQKLPPNCPSTAACGNGVATDNGSYPVVGSSNNVFNNNLVDGSFGVASPIFLDQITTAGDLVSVYPVSPFILTTSFSSKSELALNLSDDRTYLSFMAYSAPINGLDVSNSNTPSVYDPTNPVGASYYRAVAQIVGNGALQFTQTSAYSGNNGRAAITANHSFYMVGNSNNGSGTPADIIAAAGVQTLFPGTSYDIPTPVGNFSIAQVIDPSTGLPYPPDKPGKDNNFRGLTVFNNTIFVSKGSGGNGINTVYQVGNTGEIPIGSIPNLASTPINILPGFPTTLAKNPGAQNPFGIWFANATTLYVADEGDGTQANVNGPNAGLQKWTLANGTWQRAYVLQNGLSLGVQYPVSENYPAALNPATAGLRNITGRVNLDGTATIWAITSTVSANGDQGADPNKFVTITDVLSNTDPAVAASEQFVTLRSAGYGEVLRGVAFTPGTPVSAPPDNFGVTTSAFLYDRISRTYNGTLTVTNNAARLIPGPITVTLASLTPGVSLVGGSNAVTLPASSLTFGASSTVTLVFDDPANVKINFAPVVSY